MNAARPRYQFGPFIADARKRLLWRGNDPVSVTPKAFEILIALIEERGRVVEKDILVTRVWGDTAVEDATLARHISTLRRALDDRLDQRQYIVTVPGRGYTFVADAIALDAEPAAIASEITDTLSPSVEVLTTSPVADENLPRQMTWRRLTAAAVIVAACALLVSAIELSPQAAGSDAPRTLRQFTFDGGFQREPAWSPDGRQIAYTSDAGGQSDIWVQAASDTRPIRLTTSAAEESQPGWSPDGRSIVFRSERIGGLAVVPATGGPERQLTSFGHRPKWSPDGRRILFASIERAPLRYYVVDTTGGTPNLLCSDRLADFNPVDAAWTPDGNGVGLWGRRNGEWMFLVVPIDCGDVARSERSPQVDQAIRNSGLSLGRFTWSRSGRYLYFEGSSERVRNIWRVTLEPNTLAWIAGPERLTTGAGQDADIAVSPDGNRIAFVTRNSRTRLWSYPFDSASSRITGDGEPVTSGGAGELDADAPRDGSKLVYTALRGNRQEIWERRIADGRERLLISTTEWRRSRPRWSPDGLQLAYLRTRSGTSGNTDAVVTVLPVAGGEERALTRPGEVTLSPTDWSRDGRWLLGSCSIGTPRRSVSCQMPVSPLNPTNNDARDDSVRIVASDPTRNLWESRYSPNQRWITFVAIDATDARLSQIYAVPTEGGDWRPLTAGDTFVDKPHWSKDGRTLYFLSDRQGLLNVWGRRFDPERGAPIGEPFPVTTFNNPRLAVSPDLPRTQIAVTTTHLILPMAENSGELWILDGVGR